MPRPPLLAAVLLVVLALPASAQAIKPVNPTHSVHLWATVNLCDTAKHPDTIGIRGSMPGSGRRGQRMYMRIRLEYFSGRSQTWLPVGRTGDSKRFYVGSATRPLREGGQSFSFTPPALLRARVTFEWRRGHHIVYHATKVTTGGHANVHESDPKGFSASDCQLT